MLILENYQGHVCCKCGAIEEKGSFLGFYAKGYSAICDNCAVHYGCDCCATLQPYIILYEPKPNPPHPE